MKRNPAPYRVNIMHAFAIAMMLIGLLIYTLYMAFAAAATKQEVNESNSLALLRECLNAKKTVTTMRPECRALIHYIIQVADSQEIEIAKEEAK